MLGSSACFLLTPFVSESCVEVRAPPLKPPPSLMRALSPRRDGVHVHRAMLLEPSPARAVWIRQKSKPRMQCTALSQRV